MKILKLLGFHLLIIAYVAIITITIFYIQKPSLYIIPLFFFSLVYMFALKGYNEMYLVQLLPNYRIVKITQIYNTLPGNSEFFIEQMKHNIFSDIFSWSRIVQKDTEEELLPILENLKKGISISCHEEVEVIKTI